MQDILTIISICVDSVATIATVIAVIVAVRANEQTRQELKQSLVIQEQAKNVELFDKRVALLESIENNNPISETLLKMLFDNNIVNLYNEFIKCKNDIKSVDSEFSYFQRNVYKLENEVRSSDKVMTKINEYEDKLKRDCDGSVMTEFKNYCDAHIIQNNSKTYNYYEIVERQKKAELQLTTSKEKLTTSMKIYIQRTIEPIIN